MNDTRRAVLDALADGPIGGPALAERLGVSRAAVWKHVEALRDAGFEITSASDGYVLDEVPEFGGPAVEYGLDAPFEVEYHDSIPSTNDRARALAAEGAEDDVVLADEQTGGRGRLDRAWSSPTGGVWLSVVCRPALAPSRVSLLTVAASAAACGAVRKTGVDARIKWPNDLLVPDPDAARGGRKLAGLLTEMEGEAGKVSWVVLGLGLNANVAPDDLPPDATSLLGERDGDPVDRRVLTQRFLERFDALRTDPDAARDAWREHAATLGQRVRVTLPSETIVGDAVDVTDVGALVVDTGSERRVVHAGDCEHLRPAE